MAQIPSNVYNKCATYDFNLDGPITFGFLNLGIVLNPGEFVMDCWYKVLRPFVSPLPGDTFAFAFASDFFQLPTHNIFLGSQATLNLTVGLWATGNQIPQTTSLFPARQTFTPQGTPSNNFLMAIAGANLNTDGAVAINVLIGSTAL